MAGPINAGQVHLTNLGWHFSVNDFKHHFDLEQLSVINDFAAFAYAAPYLDPSQKNSVYGLIGISLGLIFWTFPHALMILTTSLRTSDARLYEAARALNTSSFKTFFMVTLPAAKYGLISTLILVE